MEKEKARTLSLKNDNKTLSRKFLKMQAKQQFTKKILLQTLEVKLTYEKVIQKALNDAALK